MPFIDIGGLSRFLDKVKALIDERIANISAPWKCRYIASGDVLVMERDVDRHTETKCVLPYKIDATGLADEANAYNDTTNETYASFPTGTDERTAKIYIDTQIPQTVNASVSFKVGSSNISPTMWTKHTYTIKCGGATLASGDFPLRTLGTVLTATGTLTSPIVEITVTAKTTAEHNVRLFGAQVDASYTTSKEWVTVMRQNQLAK